MILTPSQLATLVAQARKDAPNETCGIVGGLDGRATGIYPLKNVDEEPRVRYLADPHELLHAIREIEEARGEEVLAIYHSHPASPAFPSPTDVERAFYPEAIYIIVSLMNQQAAQVRGFRILAGQVSEVTLEVVEEVEDYGQARANPRGHSSSKR